MRKTLYKYNAETCQYERIRVKPFDVIFHVCGILVSALLLLGGMLTLHDYLIDSKKEVALRSENKALKKNHAILTSQLSAIESTLSVLDEEDRKLHIKFFGTYEERETKEPGASRRQLLLADASAFTKAVNQIYKKSAALIQQSATANYAFRKNLVPKKELINKLPSIPTTRPVQPWNTDNFISGFGMRINPFHKGLYEHPGIDVALPRGTEVVATASGVVKEIKRSKLQAGYGNFIDIDHGQGIITRYAHLEEIKVKRGQKITRGSVIATTGNSGGSIAPHLHYEIIRDGKNVDPVPYIIEGLSSKEHQHLKAISQKQNQSLD